MRRGVLGWAALLLVLGAPFVSPAQAARPEEVSAGEIAHLLSAVESSSCRFMRNGQWYEPRQAAEHLRRKYEFLHGVGSGLSAEAFIADVASRSGLSGQDYKVRCSDGLEEPCTDWLRRELARFRALRVEARTPRLPP